MIFKRKKPPSTTHRWHIALTVYTNKGNGTTEREYFKALCGYKATGIKREDITIATAANGIDVGCTDCTYALAVLRHPSGGAL
jgi:hypothetical protein